MPLTSAIGAPEHSPNNDGIHVQQSSNVFIDQTRIGTGDDCISIGDGSSHLNITNISCSPGHGISIGSLGGKGEFNTVAFVYVATVEFTGTQNGGGRGYARNIVFENISFHNSNNILSSSINTIVPINIAQIKHQLWQLAMLWIMECMEHQVETLEWYLHVAQQFHAQILL
ncbi:hypothetical protein Patl1_22124 [Pistacia atlantica]|uniref:Uncharacterized protein n=1 Tax=Pistacia atlantica TaxID=434234 RepID=A0ACC1BHZ9_9ROSI|nr:hypothetical protein Patl1_22124 [Pistacia atlantica]